MCWRAYKIIKSFNWKFYGMGQLVRHRYRCVKISLK